MTPGRRHVLFGALAVGLAAANASLLLALFEYSRLNVSASHVVLIPFVTAALIYRERSRIFSSLRWGRNAGAFLIVAGLLAILTTGLSLPSGRASPLTVSIGGLVLAWIGCFLLVYGPAASRAALFPLLWLGFMIPLPAWLLDGTTSVLQKGSAEAVAGLFTLTGTLYHRDGFAFFLPGLAIEVAEECSGIRSSIALLLTGLLAGHLFLGSSWTKAILILAILPVTVIKNGIRIVGLSFLAMHVDSGFLAGQLHHEGGVVFFLMALIFLTPVLVLLRRSERRPAPRARRQALPEATA